MVLPWQGWKEDKKGVGIATAFGSYADVWADRQEVNGCDAIGRGDRGMRLCFGSTTESIKLVMFGRCVSLHRVS